MRTTPWNADREVPRDEDVKIDIPGQEEEVQQVPQAEDTDRDRRRFHIKVNDVRTDGETPGCPGCAYAMGRG